MNTQLKIARSTVSRRKSKEIRNRIILLNPETPLGVVPIVVATLYGGNKNAKS